MAKSKKSGAKSTFIWLLLLGSGFLAYRVQQKGTLFDEAQIAAIAGSIVDDALAAQGVRDSQILKSVRVERKQWFPAPRSWIETERKIGGVSFAAAEKILADVKKSAAGRKLTAFTAVDQNKTTLQLGRGARLYQRVVFIHGKRLAKISVAIVIDDVAGRPGDMGRLDEFLALGIPLTFALMPMEKETSAAAQKIHRKGHEVILHQPMEPKDPEINPQGKAGMFKSMAPSQIFARLQADLASVPHAAGFSNHMGSEFTAHEGSMEALLDSAKRLSAKYPGLYFFDSHTAEKPLSPKIASEIGVPHLVNDAFLDNADSIGAVARQLEILKSKALRDGQAIAIGHIQRKHTAKAIGRAIPEFRKEGIQFVRLSDLLK